MPASTSEVFQISAEIASAQQALVSARDGAMRASIARAASGSGASTPRDAKRRPDAAWLALEERVAAQVAGLQQKHDAEHLDSERVLRSSVTRLESRVRTVEGQGVRADRRSAELAGLAQALTEEQRTLLIRLDRLEERMKGCRSVRSEPDQQALTEEWISRLSRLEREQRAVAMNLRLVVSVAEEAQERQHQRLQDLEERVICSRAVDSLRTPDLGAAERQAFHGLEAGTGDGQTSLLQPQVHAHEQELAAVRARMDAHTSVLEDLATKSSEAVEVLNVRLTDLGSSLKPRADAMEARIQALTDLMDEHRFALEAISSKCDSRTGKSAPILQATVHELPGNLIEQAASMNKSISEHAEAIADLRKRIEEQGIGRVVEHKESIQEQQERSDSIISADQFFGISKKVEVQAEAIGELRTLLQKLPVLRQMTGIREAHIEATSDEIVAAPSQAITEAVQRHAKTHFEALQMHLDRKCSEIAEACAQDLAEMKQSLSVHASETGNDAWSLGGSSSELEGHIRELRNQCAELQEVVDQNVMISIWDLNRELPATLEKVERLNTESMDRDTKLEEHGVRLNLVLAKVGTQEQRLQGCMDRLERLPTSNQVRMMTCEEFRKQLEDVDVHGLAKRVDLQGQAVDELGERVQVIQNVCNNLAFKGSICAESRPWEFAASATC